MRRSRFLLAAASAIALAGISASAPSAQAQSRSPDPAAPGRPVGTIVITARAVAVGVGYTWGDGILNFRGRQYHFEVKGVTVADVGFARITGRGRVYGLTKVEDFDGTYGAATGEATLGNGIGGQFLRNGNGVQIRVDEVTRGARLSGSADGIQFTLRR